jgi:hypothetical protein
MEVFNSGVYNILCMINYFVLDSLYLLCPLHNPASACILVDILHVLCDPLF